MPLHTNSPRLEKILGFGLSNSGRSSMWIALADWIAQTGSDAKVHVGLTDNSWDDVRYDRIEEVVRVRDLDIRDFRPWMEWVEGLEVKRDDWVVVDRADVAYEAAQQTFHMEDSGRGMLEVLMEDKKAKDTKGAQGKYMAGAHGVNWDLAKRYYFSVMGRLDKINCHRLYIADAREIREDNPQAVALRDKWKGGVYPKGQGDLPGPCMTWLYCAEGNKGHVYTTIRDKTAIGQEGRELLKGEVVSDFVMTYLVPVAGWEL
jgi:hypothetical protein